MTYSAARRSRTTIAGRVIRTAVFRFATAAAAGADLAPLLIMAGLWAGTLWLLA